MKCFGHARELSEYKKVVVIFRRSNKHICPPQLSNLQTLIIMQVAAILLVCLAVANAAVIPATTFIRTPQFDSAIIKSDRLGGNFAYSTVEGHAYAAVSPVVQNVLTPVGVSTRLVASPYYAYPAPAPIAVPAPVPAPLPVAGPAVIDAKAYPGYPLTYVA